MKLVKEMNSIFTNFSKLHKPDFVVTCCSDTLGQAMSHCFVALAPPCVSACQCYLMLESPQLLHSPLNMLSLPTTPAPAPLPAEASLLILPPCRSRLPVPSMQLAAEQADVHGRPRWGSLAVLWNRKSFYMLYYFIVYWVIGCLLIHCCVGIAGCSTCIESWEDTGHNRLG